MATPTERPRLPLRGRAQELADLQAAIDGVDDHGSVFVFRGDRGVGKSALLLAGRDAAARRGFLTLHAVGVAAESDLRFAGLHGLLRPLMIRISELPAAQRAILHVAFSTLRADADDPFLMALAALDLLSAQAVDQPVLIVADDLHLMDRSSRAVLGFIARRIAGDRIVVLAAAGNEFDAQTDELGLQVQDLTPVDLHAAGEILDTRAPGLEGATRRRLLAEAAGNPLALHELSTWAPTVLAAGKAFTREVLPVSPRLRQAFTRPLEDVPEDTVLLLTLGAADTSASTSELLSAAALLTGNCPSVAALQPAIDAGLITFDGIDLRFRHPVVRSAIYESADLRQRRSIHGALAEVLSAEPERRLTHRAEAGLAPDDALAQDIEDEALRALERGADQRAAEWFALAAELSVAASERVQRLLRSAELANGLGLAGTVRALCKQIRQHPLQAHDRLRVASLSADPDAPGGEASILELVELAERAAAIGDADLSVDLLLRAATRCWWGAPGQEALRRVATTMTRVCGDVTDPRRVAALSICAPTAAHAVGHHRMPASTSRTSGQSLRREGRLGLLAHNLGMQALETVQSGDWRAGAAAAAEAARLADDTGQLALSGLASTTLAALAGARGREQEAGAHAAAAAAKLERCPTAAGRAWLQLALGLTALAAERTADAYAELARIFDPLDLAFHPRVQYVAIGLLADAATTRQQREDARRWCERLGGDATGLIYARAVLTDGEAAEEAFASAAQALEVTFPFDHARLQLAHGTWLRGRKRLADARKCLRAARDGFDLLDADPWGARARRELHAAGELCSPSGEAVASALTARELVIARMAAEGLSNREIGQRLYLSHRTIASNLYRMFPKLGVTSRGQLHGVVSGA